MQIRNIQIALLENKKPAYETQVEMAASRSSFGKTNLLPLVRAFEGVVHQPAENSSDNRGHDNEDISEIHNSKLFHFNSDNGKDYSDDTGEDVKYCKSLSNLFTYHIFSSRVEKEMARYRNKREDAIPTAESPSLALKGIILGMAWFTAAARNNPLAMSLKYSETIEDWDLDNCIIHNHHSRGLIFCQ